ncbi:ATP-binding protein [Streptomyces bobili]|uniref:ATP-binding protein n=1 Tax=Streptomyces bobili TaxID=67280 RepID=UPI0033E565B9
MDLAGQDEGQEPLVDRQIAVCAVFEGSAAIGEARDMARDFLTSVQAVHGLPVPSRAMGVVQLVVSELVTNARKYAQGPCRLMLDVADGVVRVDVWDSSTTLPAVLGADPERIGQHGLEIVMAVCRSFAVQQEPVGKRITATVVLADEPGGAAAGHLTM